MNLKVEPVDPSSVLTGLEVILYPRQTDLTADNADYQASLEPLGGICEPWHQGLYQSVAAHL